MPDQPDDIHGADPDTFLDEVHSFEHWFGAVETYLSDLEHGHRKDLEAAVLDADERQALLNILANYVVAETVALEASSGLVRIAPNSNCKIFLATQVVDEARHVEIMLQRMRDLGVSDPEAEVEERSTSSIWTFREKLLQLVDAGEWDSAIFAQNVVLEAMEFAVFNAHIEVADPVTRDLLERALRDERRHLGFGENEIGRRLRHDPKRKLWLRTVKTELDSLVLDTFEFALQELNIPRDERPDLGREYLAAVSRLGID